MAPPAASKDDTKLVREARAEKMQKLLDDQVVKLASSEWMLKFLHRQNKDPIPCKRCNRQHARRLLEILLHKLEIAGKIQETEHSKNTVIFEILEGTQWPLVSAVGGLASQLSF